MQSEVTVMSKGTYHLNLPLFLLYLLDLESKIFNVVPFLASSLSYVY